MDEKEPLEPEPTEEENKEEVQVRKGWRGLLDRWRAFRERVPGVAKALIAILILMSVFGAGFTAFTTYNFTQNNPTFCNSCHIMNESFIAWQKSEHKEINCHECHHLSIQDLNALMVSAFIRRTEKVPVRYGKIIVPWKYCISCHWESDERYPTAVKINASNLHAKHYFMQKIECSKCHGYRVHKFSLEERYCLECHKGKEVHGKGMVDLPCLNCHTDRTPTLLPGPNKCLFCHGDDSVRAQLLHEDTLDVSHFQPSEETIKKAVKIDRPDNAPMRFFCYQCHKPHQKVRPDYGTCISCHSQIVNVGKHKLHIQTVGLECTNCHKPHSWRVTIKEGKKICTECHGYKDPMTFIGPG